MFNEAIYFLQSDAKYSDVQSNRENMSPNIKSPLAVRDGAIKRSTNRKSPQYEKPFHSRKFDMTKETDVKILNIAKYNIAALKSSRSNQNPIFSPKLSKSGSSVALSVIQNNLANTDWVRELNFKDDSLHDQSNDKIENDTNILSHFTEEDYAKLEADKAALRYALADKTNELQNAKSTCHKQATLLESTALQLQTATSEHGEQ